MSATAAAEDALVELLFAASDPTAAVDHLQILEAVKPLLAPTLFEDIAAAIDVCPVHVRDIEICLDDDEDCTRRVTDEEAQR